MIRLYAGLGIAAVLIAAWLRYDYVVTDRDAAKASLATALASLVDARLLVETERIRADEAAERASEYYASRVKSNEELEKLRTCIADKSCVPRVRVVQACPTSGVVPEAGANAGTLETSTAELDADAQRIVLRLYDQARELTDLYLSAQAEVEARSKPDYCERKKPGRTGQRA